MKSNKKYNPKAPRPNRRLRPYESIYNNLLHRNRHPVKISYEEYFDVIKDQICHYCSSQLNMCPYRKKGQSTASCIDRKDTLLPYTVENTVPCCPKCNYGKGKWYTYKEWLVVGRALANLERELEKELNG